MFDLGRVLKPGVSPAVNHQRTEKVKRERLLLWFCCIMICLLLLSCRIRYIYIDIDVLFLLVRDAVFSFLPKAYLSELMFSVAKITNIFLLHNTGIEEGNNTSWPRVLDHTHL